MMKMTVKNRLMLAFLTILILPCSSIGWFSYQEAKNQVSQQIELNAQQSVEMTNNQIKEIMASSLSDVDYLATKLGANSTYPEVRQQLENFLIVNPEFENVHFATNTRLMYTLPELKLPADFDPTVRPWWIKAVNNAGKAVVNDAIASADGSGNVVVIQSKISNDGAGVVGATLKLSKMAEQVRNIKVGQMGYVAILDKDRKIVIHPTEKPGTRNEDPFIEKFYEKDSGTVDYVFDGTQRKAIFATNPETGWKIIGAIDVEEFSSSTQGILYTTIAVIAVAIVIGILLVFWIVRSITKPLKELMSSTGKIADGDLSEEIVLRSKDELGQLSASVNQMRISLRHLIGQVGLNTDHVASTSEQLSASAEQTSRATEQISTAIQEVALGSEKQVSSATEAAEAAAEISRGMNQAASSIQNVADLTSTASNKANIGNKVVTQTVEQMNRVQLSVSQTSVVVNTLGEKSKEIGHIVELITQIANQTNLLALNAAIEAARAGEQGRGFAVVANEVRKLAEQSGDAAAQIRELIHEIQTEAGKAVESMNDGTSIVKEGIEMVHLTGETFGDIVNSIERLAAESQEVSAIVEQVNSSSQSMVEMMEGVAHIAVQSAGNTQNVAASAEEQNASMEEVAASADALNKMAQELQDVISKFKV